MATTRNAKSVTGPLLRSVKFDVTADNDLLLDGGNYLVLGAYFDGLATAINIDSGSDVATSGTQVASDETLNATATGAGTVTLFFAEIPDAGMPTFDV